MKRWQVTLLIVVGLVVLSQIPFAVRRYKLGRLRAAIDLMNSQRQPAPDDKFAEFSGAFHVHSFLGGHSTGTFNEIISAAQSNELDFVVMTEHPARDFDTSELTLKGLHGGVLFINGNEVKTSDGDRLLLLPGNAQANSSDSQSTAEVMSRARATGALPFVAYPEEFRHWEAGDFAGIEVYNVYSDARRLNPLVMFFDGLWSYRSHPELLFARFYERPAGALEKWDTQIAMRGRRIVAVAGNDAHANIGLSLNDSSGKTILGAKLDPYSRTFQLVRTHVLISQNESLTQQSLMSALAAGHSFIGFDLFGDSTGFRFRAIGAGEEREQGDEVSLARGLQLEVKTPIPARVVVFKEGKVLQEQMVQSTAQFPITEPGTYRTELYLPQLGIPVSQQPWVISNPIYVR